MFIPRYVGRHKIESKFLMASGFYHKAYSEPDADFFDIVQVYEETNDAYIGSFVFGLGLIDVVFPKNCTRELTKDEILQYDGKFIAINNNPPFSKINIKENKFEGINQSF